MKKTLFRTMYRIMDRLFSISIFCIAFSFFLNHSLDPDLEYTQVIKREFPVGKSGNLKLLSKFGEVEVKNWEKDLVKVEVRIVVEAPNERAASQVFRQIEVNFFNQESLIKILMNITPASTLWWLSDSYTSPEKENFSISYRIHLPKGFSFESDLQYGDVIIGEIQKDVDLNLKHGKIDIGAVGGKTRLDLELVEGVLKNLNHGELIIKNSQLVISKANVLTMSSQNSTIKIESVDELRLHSKYDDYRIKTVYLMKNVGKFDNIQIEEVTQLTLDAEESKLTINELIENAQVDLNKGWFYLNSTSTALKSLTLTGYDAQFKIQLPAEFNYELIANAHQAGIQYPSNLEIINESITINSHQVRGKKKAARYSYDAPIIHAIIEKGGLRIEEF